MKKIKREDYELVEPEGSNPCSECEIFDYCYSLGEFEDAFDADCTNGDDALTWKKKSKTVPNIVEKVEVVKELIVLSGEEFAKLLAAFIETGEYLSVEVKQENNGVILVDLASFTPLKRFTEYVLNNYKP